MPTMIDTPKSLLYFLTSFLVTWVQVHMYHGTYVDTQKTAFMSLFSLPGIKSRCPSLCITRSYLPMHLSSPHNHFLSNWASSQWWVTNGSRWPPCLLCQHHHLATADYSRGFLTHAGSEEHLTCLGIWTLTTRNVAFDHFTNLKKGLRAGKGLKNFEIFKEDYWGKPLLRWLWRPRVEKDSIVGGESLSPWVSPQHMSTLLPYRLNLMEMRGRNTSLLHKAARFQGYYRS